MRRLVLAAAVLLVAFAGLGLVGASPSVGSPKSRWVVSDLGTLPAARHAELTRASWPVALNERGQVVGVSTTRGGEWPRAFLWQDGRIVDLGALGRRQPRGVVGSARSWATAINDRGDIVGQSDAVASGIHAFLWSGGTMRDLGTLGGRESRAEAVNNSGQVVGWAETAGGSRHVFFWRTGTCGT